MPEVLVISVDDLRSRRYVRAAERGGDHVRFVLGRPIEHWHAYHCYVCDRVFLESLEGMVAVEAGASMRFASGAFLSCREPDIFAAFCTQCAPTVRRCRNCGCSRSCPCPAFGIGGERIGSCKWVAEATINPAGPICTCCAVVGRDGSISTSSNGSISTSSTSSTGEMEFVLKIVREEGWSL